MMQTGADAANGIPLAPPLPEPQAGAGHVLPAPMPLPPALQPPTSAVPALRLPTQDTIAYLQVSLMSTAR